MATPRNDPGAVDAYIAGFDEPTRTGLRTLRELFRRVLPDADEYISYRIPTYKSDAARVHFAGYEHHLGIYPVDELPSEIEKRVVPLRSGAATLRIPLDAPIDDELIVAVLEAQVEHQRTLKKY